MRSDCVDAFRHEQIQHVQNFEINQLKGIYCEIIGELDAHHDHDCGLPYPVRKQLLHPFRSVNAKIILRKWLNKKVGNYWNIRVVRSLAPIVIIPIQKIE